MVKAPSVSGEDERALGLQPYCLVGHNRLALCGHETTPAHPLWPRYEPRSPRKAGCTPRVPPILPL